MFALRWASSLVDILSLPFVPCLARRSVQVIDLIGQSGARTLSRNHYFERIVHLACGIITWRVTGLLG